LADRDALLSLMHPRAIYRVPALRIAFNRSRRDSTFQPGSVATGDGCSGATGPPSSCHLALAAAPLLGRAGSAGPNCCFEPADVSYDFPYSEMIMACLS
jgi:hypothetical protein